jgi:hypothetical protein
MDALFATQEEICVDLEVHTTAGREAGATVLCAAGRKYRWTTDTKQA